MPAPLQPEFRFFGRWPSQARREIEDARHGVKLNFDAAYEGAGFISPSDIESLVSAGSAAITLGLMLWDRWIGSRKREARKEAEPASPEESRAAESVANLEEFNERLQSEGYFEQRVRDVNFRDDSGYMVIVDGASGTTRRFLLDLFMSRAWTPG